MTKQATIYTDGGALRVKVDGGLRMQEYKSMKIRLELTPWAGQVRIDPDHSGLTVIPRNVGGNRLAELVRDARIIADEVLSSEWLSLFQMDDEPQPEPVQPSLF